jgi:hypothetical protein
VIRRLPVISRYQVGTHWIKCGLGASASLSFDDHRGGQGSNRFNRWPTLSSSTSNPIRLAMCPHVHGPNSPSTLADLATQRPIHQTAGSSDLTSREGGVYKIAYRHGSFCYFWLPRKMLRQPIMTKNGLDFSVFNAFPKESMRVLGARFCFHSFRTAQSNKDIASR